MESLDPLGVGVGAVVGAYLLPVLFMCFVFGCLCVSLAHMKGLEPIGAFISGFLLTGLALVYYAGAPDLRLRRALQQLGAQLDTLGTMAQLQRVQLGVLDRIESGVTSSSVAKQEAGDEQPE